MSKTHLLIKHKALQLEKNKVFGAIPFENAKKWRKEIKKAIIQAA